MMMTLDDPIPKQSHVRARLRHEDGFTYVGLLILLAVIGIAAAASIQMGGIVQRRAAEEELLAIGVEFRTALISYANATPAGQKRAPSSLQDLLKDPRYPNTRRHLRKIYIDPLTGKADWGLVQNPDGSGIVGIYSLSDAKPIKVGNFDLPFVEFANKASYKEWVFMAPQVVQPTAPVTVSPDAPLSNPVTP
jgi:type II secretory pathway pseudopilin PulG